MNYKDGEIFWSISPSVESEGYGDYDPVKPWKGKIVINHAPAGDVAYLCHFDEETGVVDEDTNATAFVGDGKWLFASLNLAKLGYQKAIMECAKEALNKYAAKLLDAGMHYASSLLTATANHLPL